MGLVVWHDIVICAWLALLSSNSAESTACFPVAPIPSASHYFDRRIALDFDNIPSERSSSSHASASALQRLAVLSILWNSAVTLLLNALSQFSHTK